MSSKFTVFVKYGSNRDLSKLETSVLLERIKIRDIIFQEWKNNVLLKLSVNERERLFRLLEQTGSIVKSGRIEIEEHLQKEEIWKEHLSELLQREMLKKYKRTKKQLKITLSIQSSETEITKSIHKTINKTIQRISSELDVPVKVLKLKDETYEQTPFQFHKESIDRRGFEVTGFVVKSKIFLGITEWVTNPLIDIKQDEERKVRFFTHGTSIKLARSLIFLSQVQEGGTILDPFCGTGTILLQGLIQGIEVIGIDKDPKCFRASKENLNQLSMQFPAKDKMKEKWKVFRYDSRYLSSILTNKVDAIVTEPYLGPFLKEIPETDEAEVIMQELEALYISVLKASNPFLKSDSRVIMIVPEYQYNNNMSILPDLVSIARECSLKLENQSKFLSVKLPVVIGRQHNIIGRKLAIFTKEG